MSYLHRVLVVTIILASWWTATGTDSRARAAEDGSARLPAPAMPHDLLKRDVGVWDATIQMAAEPGGAMGVYNGTETNTLANGGLWLVTDFRSRIDGTRFEGHALLGYDAQMEKYVRVWVDSTQSWFWPSQGVYDPATDSLTLWMISTDSGGNPVRWRSVSRWNGPDIRVFTMYVPGPDSTEAAGMTITYKRRRDVP